MKDIAEFLEPIEEAEMAFEAAKLALAEDKERRRKGGIIGKIVDFVTDTQAEKNFVASENLLKTVRYDTEVAVRGFIEAEAVRYLTEEGIHIDEREAQHARLKAARAANDKVVHLASLGQRAHQALTKAKESSSSAASTETIDAVTSNKLVSAMSHISTGNAKTAVAEANAALKAFVEAANQSKVANGQIDALDDTFDFIMDIAFDFPIDFFSWSNASKLRQQSSKCEEAAREVENALSAMEPALKSASEAVAQEATALLDIDFPYLLAAAESLPAPLRYAIPEYLATRGELKAEATAQSQAASFQFA